jgi:hypothetical protein
MPHTMTVYVQTRFAGLTGLRPLVLRNVIPLCATAPAHFSIAGNML